MWPTMSSAPPGDDDDDTLADTSDPRAALRTQATLEAIVNRDPLAFIQALEELDAEFNFDFDDEEKEIFKEALQANEYASSPTSDLDESSLQWAESSFDSSTNPLFQIASPIAIDLGGANDAFGIFAGANEKQVSLGFEDDFSVFVSAPPRDDDDGFKLVDHDFSHLRFDESRSGSTTPEGHLLRAGEHAGSLYHSLGSSSDLHSVEVESK